MACNVASSQATPSTWTRDSIRITMDIPQGFNKKKPSVIVFYALPNGNSTEQTMGKKIKEADDWHFDIQHIAAQTKFVRQQYGRSKNLVVIYLANNRLSWPSWKQSHDYKNILPRLIDSLAGSIPSKRKEIYLNGHSGGGSLIFGFLASVQKIPSSIKRISFLDSNYGYDSSYYPKIREWLNEVKGSALNVFAYNDSVALLNGKSFVSATGGTWYRSHLMLRHLHQDFSFEKTRDDSLIVYKSLENNIQFFLKTNPARKIYHTTQVELNGFIHSVLCGTPLDSKDYTYYGERAYSSFIE
jgi:hypothetical protein